MKLDYSDITDIILTKQQADHFIDILDCLKDSAYSTKTPFVKKIENTFPHELQSAIMTSFEKNNISIENARHISETIADIQKVIKTLAIVTIRIAYEPTTLQLKMILANLQVYTRKKVIIALDIDYSLVGGAILEYKGKYADYSLKGKINSGQF